MKLIIRLAASALCLFLALCAYWAANGPEQDENKGLYAPNVMHRMQLPCPPPCNQQELERILKGAGDGNEIVMINKVSRH